MPEANRPFDPILEETISWNSVRRARHVIYLHPARLREMVRDLSQDELVAMGLWPQERRQVYGFEVIETARIPEAPGWLVLPRPPKRNLDGSLRGSRHRDQFHPRERS